MEPATVQSLNPQGDLVVGVDGSQESFGALRWALRQAALSGQTVNAVYGWSYSWDMGPDPPPTRSSQKLRTQIAEKLRDWVKDAAEGIDIDSDQIRLTSFRASGTSALGLRLAATPSRSSWGGAHSGGWPAGSPAPCRLRSPRNRRFP